MLPDWKEKNPADIGVALVELLAYASNQLSYYQDAVATEAYLGTARRRISVRRHARLLDYPMHDGCNARAFVFFECTGGAGVAVPAGTLLLTRTNAMRGIFLRAKKQTALNQGSQPFETLFAITARAQLNAIDFYTWGHDLCCLPKGAAGQRWLITPLPVSGNWRSFALRRNCRSGYGLFRRCQSGAPACRPTHFSDCIH